ncbi:uncharacterized protein EAF01_005564 [Botrytis porri]|uniref:uncharacterized protein n=1 Tax=Botrytis porri TaxID=87229 RepID=UPI00190157A0|nr:uncharacterized protein EAF01_005564 [Botrytis porri]KAF7905043.1 hypothetical protein EAF01_005564 [Botrytis porri]
MELNRSTLSCIVVSIIALHLISKLVQGRREEEILQKRDCSRPRHYSHKDPVWGIGLFVGIVESISNGNNFAFFQSLFDKYGKAFEVNSWGQKAIYTIDAENIHTILVKSQKKFIVEPSSLHATECFLGRGIFNTDGSSWKQAHLASKPIFARAQIPILDILEEHMDTLLAMIPHDGTTVDLLPRLKRLFLDTSTALIFGDSINILKSEKGQIDTEKFLAAFDTVLQGIGLRVALGKFASAKPRQVLEEGSKAEKTEKTEKTSISTNSPSPNRRLVLLDELLKTAQDHIYLCSHIFFNLARNPEVWNRLQNEISNYDGPLIYDSLKQMRYANAIVDESLRILAPSGRSIRSCGEDRILRTGGGPNGKDLILVIRGTEVNYIFRSMHLDKDIWGAEADEYRPERWESLGKAQLRAYIPFSEGD